MSGRKRLVAGQGIARLRPCLVACLAPALWILLIPAWLGAQAPPPPSSTPRTGAPLQTGAPPTANSSTALAQAIPGQTQGEQTAADGSSEQLRDSPERLQDATIRGTVRDSSGSAVAGAIVTLASATTASATGATGASEQTSITDAAGSFRFAAVEPGNHTLRITASGFTPWEESATVAVTGEPLPAFAAVLEVAPLISAIEVGLSQKERAVEQLKAEEKQKLLGVLPNYFVTYVPNAAPLSAAQKFDLGLKTMTNPMVFVSAGIAAGVQQWRNTYPGFGQGTEGYAKRMGAQYAEGVSAIFIGRVVTHALLHQDPRYFYKNGGSRTSRLLYAIGTAFLSKGDNGHWQFDYSDVLGGLAATELSTLWYPPNTNTRTRLARNLVFGFAGRAANHLMQQFVLRKLTTNVPATGGSPAGPVLREGTPLSLISVQDLSAKKPEDSGPITFALAADLDIDKTTVAKAGTEAWGHARYSRGPGNAIQMELEGMRLKVGKIEVPLRIAPAPKIDAPLQSHPVENSGRIAVTLYVAKSVEFPAQR